MQSWKSGTKKQYNTHINRWFCYCSKRKISPISPTLETVVEFLTELFNKGLGYETLNTARAALSALGINFEGFRIGNHPLIIRYMKGVFAARPSQPRYSEIWDVNKVLVYLKKLSPVKRLSLKDLTLKLVMLMALIQAARVQTLQLISFIDYKKLKTEFVFKLDDLLKQNRPGCNIVFISLKAYPPDRRLCIYTVLKEYLSRTRTIRTVSNSNKLLLSYIKPYKNVTRDTISRWIKTVMCRSGIDTKIYGSHSVRSASSSKAKVSGVPIATILERAGWSSESTFARFYSRKITSDRDQYQESVLRH